MHSYPSMVQVMWGWLFEITLLHEWWIYENKKSHCNSIWGGHLKLSRPWSRRFNGNYFGLVFLWSRVYLSDLEYNCFWEFESKFTFTHLSCSFSNNHPHVMNSVERIVVTVTIMIHGLGVLVTEAECSGTATTNIILQVVCFWNSIAVP